MFREFDGAGHVVSEPVSAVDARDRLALPEIQDEPAAAERVDAWLRPAGRWATGVGSFSKSDVALVTVSMGLQRIWLHGFFDFIAVSVDARHSAEIRDMKVTR